MTSIAMYSSVKYNNKVNILSMKQEKEFYKAVDLAKVLEVDIMTIYRYIKAGRLKAYKIGRDFRIDKQEFQAFLKKASTKHKII